MMPIVSFIVNLFSIDDIFNEPETKSFSSYHFDRYFYFYNDKTHRYVSWKNSEWTDHICTAFRIKNDPLAAYKFEKILEKIFSDPTLNKISVIIKEGPNTKKVLFSRKEIENQKSKIKKLCYDIF